LILPIITNTIIRFIRDITTINIIKLLFKMRSQDLHQQLNQQMLPQFKRSTLQIELRKKLIQSLRLPRPNRSSKKPTQPIRNQNNQSQRKRRKKHLKKKKRPISKKIQRQSKRHKRSKRRRLKQLQKNLNQLLQRSNHHQPKKRSLLLLLIKLLQRNQSHSRIFLRKENSQKILKLPRQILLPLRMINSVKRCKLRRIKEMSNNLLPKPT